MATNNVQNNGYVVDKALSFFRNVSAKIEKNTTKVIALIEELPEKAQKAKSEVVDYATTTPESLKTAQKKINKQIEKMNAVMKRE